MDVSFEFRIENHKYIDVSRVLMEFSKIIHTLNENYVLNTI